MRAGRECSVAGPRHPSSGLGAGGALETCVYIGVSGKSH